MRKSDGYKRLNEAFLYVDDRFLDIVENQKRLPSPRSHMRISIKVAICIIALILIPVCGCAMNLFGLRDLLLQIGQEGQMEQEKQEDREESPSVGRYSQEDGRISLSGFRDSPEAQALAEWTAYCDDHVSQIVAELGNGVFVAEGRPDWEMYMVYSYEMGEKLDEIADKYGLKLHRNMNVVSYEELAYRVGGNFLSEDCIRYWGYIYDDGSFQGECDVDLADYGTVALQYARAVKGTFDEVTLNIGSVEDYTEWQYVTACGESVLLALSSHKALIFADFEDCFFSANILQGTRNGIGRDALQQIADQFDLSVLKKVQIPDMRGDSVAPRSDTETVNIGELKNLGTGRLFYVITEQDEIDYKLYFVKTKDTDWLYDLSDYDLDAAYVFPDVRENNASIGRFWQIYFFQEADITGDGKTDLILVARYEDGDAITYDTRIYEWKDDGYVPVHELMDELNEQYWNTDSYPVDEMMALPVGD
ncbi:MAG: hypothetical protein NC417_12590 [Candidatus Gastranaerophilales bacterium]|nr:hypothetical protein [Candidatus Gastranaerophilales bacterium]